jgi:PAS domain-containing protein
MRLWTALGARMRGRIGGLLCAAALLLASEAQASPVALLDAPRASAVAVAGDEVLVARPAARGAVRIDALPAAGGAPRNVVTIPRPAPRMGGEAELAASAQQVAAIVTFGDEGGFPIESQLWLGPPAGPLRQVRRVRWSARRGWMPVEVDVDGDRVLVAEMRLRDLRTRLRVLVPGAPPHRVPLRRAVRPPAALAGDRVAIVDRRGRAVVADWRTGAVVGRSDERDVVDLDLAADGRVATETEDGRLEAPRFAGDRLVVLEPARFDALRPVLVDGAPVGLPTSALEGLAAGDAGVAWLANGCVLFAPLAGPPPTEPPAGPCPRAEAWVEEGSQVLRGRRLGFLATCVAAPAAGCRGTVLVRGEGTGVLGRGRFEQPPGTRGRLDVVLTRRGVRYVNVALRREGDAFLGVRVRVHQGRHSDHGASGAVVDRRVRRR